MARLFTCRRLLTRRRTASCAFAGDHTASSDVAGERRRRTAQRGDALWPTLQAIRPRALSIRRKSMIRNKRDLLATAIEIIEAIDEIFRIHPSCGRRSPQAHITGDVRQERRAVIEASHP